MRMLEKLNRILSIILIIIVVGVAALWVFVGMLRIMPVASITPKTEKPSAAQETMEIPADERVLEMLNTFFSADELATPENQQLISVNVVLNALHVYKNRFAKHVNADRLNP